MLTNLIHPPLHACELLDSWNVYGQCKLFHVIFLFWGGGSLKICIQKLKKKKKNCKYRCISPLNKSSIYSIFSTFSRFMLHVNYIIKKKSGLALGFHFLIYFQNYLIYSQITANFNTWDTSMVVFVMDLTFSASCQHMNMGVIHEPLLLALNFRLVLLGLAKSI